MRQGHCHCKKISSGEIVKLDLRTRHVQKYLQWWWGTVLCDFPSGCRAEMPQLSLYEPKIQGNPFRVWCVRNAHTLPCEKVRLKVLVRASSMWVCWILVVTMLSALVVTNMAAKSIPSFLPVSGPWIGRVEVCIGLFQGILSGVLLPSLAGLVSSKGGARRPALVSVATMLITFFIPALAVLYLDGACLDRWTLWWPPCTDKGQHMFNIEAPVRVHEVQETRTILHHRDVCTPKGHQSVSSCTRSVALHLQGLILSKLLTAAFSLPTARLVWGKYYELTDTVVVKLALLLELGMLLGPSLPVIIPLLSIGVLTERMLAAVSWDAGFLQSVSRRGDARFAIAATGMCSLVFYGCFMFDSTPACVLLLLTCVMLLKDKVTMANVWGRHPPLALLKGRRVSTYGTEHRPSWSPTPQHHVCMSVNPPDKPTVGAPSLHSRLKNASAMHGSWEKVQGHRKTQLLGTPIRQDNG